MTYINSITSKGQVTLPKEFRDKLGLGKPGKARISLNDRGQVVIDKPPTLADTRKLLARPAGNEPLSKREAAIVAQISEKCR